MVPVSRIFLVWSRTQSVGLSSTLSSDMPAINNPRAVPIPAGTGQPALSCPATWVSKKAKVRRHRRDHRSGSHREGNNLFVADCSWPMAVTWPAQPSGARP
ncbi:hypothetical protein GCM10020220_040130 [Nonomuraea rubra]